MVLEVVVLVVIVVFVVNGRPSNGHSHIGGRHVVVGCSGLDIIVVGFCCNCSSL